VLDLAAGLKAPWSVPVEATVPDVLGGLVHRPTVYSRKAVSWISVRSWAAKSRIADIAAVKVAKRAVDQGVIDAAAYELAAILRKMIGPATGWTVTNIPCGHSQRPDCFGKRLSAAVAQQLGIVHLEVWADRFCTGSSHPKEFAKLGPLEWIAAPTSAMIVIDDVATSGWHMEEALTALRNRDITALGVVWISGTVT